MPDLRHESMGGDTFSVDEIMRRTQKPMIEVIMDVELQIRSHLTFYFPDETKEEKVHGDHCDGGHGFLLYRNSCFVKFENYCCF